MPDNRNPFMTNDQLTMAAVLQKVEADTALKSQRRRNLCSAIRALGKLMDKDLSYLPAQPGYYRKLFKELHPEHCGLSRSRIANIKSDVLFALKRVGCIEGARTYMVPFTEAWQVLWDKAVVAGRLRRDVSRMMHFCSAQSIDPGDVDDIVADRLRNAMVDESFVNDPIRTHKGILRTWNKLVDCVRDWPQVKLTISNDRDDYSIPLDQFPQSFRNEVSALVKQWEAKDILDDTGPIKPLKPRTIKSRLYRLRQAASAIVLSGTPIEEIPSIATLVEVEAAKIILRFYLDRAHGKPTSQIHGIAVLLKTLARHWVRVDEDHLDALKALCTKVDPGIKGLTTKNRDRLRQFDDPKNTCLLLDFPFRQMNLVLSHDEGRRRDAVQAQIALAVALLLMMPVRASNLVGLHIERHIQRTRSGKKGAVHVVIPGHEVKNEEDLEFELPKEVVQLLDRYLNDYHPRLTDEPSPWLFPGRSPGEHKAVITLGEQVKAHVFKATGLHMNLHLFRHTAAKLYLDAMPGGYEVVRRLLGHKSSDTTVRFYAGMESKSASRHYDDVILQLHRDLKEQPRDGQL